MNRWIAISGALVLALLVAVGTGVALTQLIAAGGVSHPVVMKTVTPGGLERDGIRLTAAATPPVCALPYRLPGCPVSKSVAEAAAAKSLGMAAPAAVRESVLARVDTDPHGGTGRSIHGTQWVVAVDRSLPIGVMTCIRPVRPSSGPAAMLPCGAGRSLVFVDAGTGKPTLTITRP
jgi:hypothetical protein